MPVSLGDPDLAVTSTVVASRSVDSGHVGDTFGPWL